MFDWSIDPRRIKDGNKVPENFVYQSDTNEEWMTVTQLQQWVESNKAKIGTF